MYVAPKKSKHERKLASHLMDFWKENASHSFSIKTLYVTSCLQAAGQEIGAEDEKEGKKIAVSAQAPTADESWTTKMKVVCLPLSLCFYGKYVIFILSPQFWQWKHVAVLLYWYFLLVTVEVFFKTDIILPLSNNVCLI